MPLWEARDPDDLLTAVSPNGTYASAWTPRANPPIDVGHEIDVAGPTPGDAPVSAEPDPRGNQPDALAAQVVLEHVARLRRVGLLMSCGC